MVVRGRSWIAVAVLAAACSSKDPGTVSVGAAQKPTASASGSAGRYAATPARDAGARSTSTAGRGSTGLAQDAGALDAGARDGGSRDSGPTPLPPPVTLHLSNYVFATSSSHTVDFGSLEAADAICNTAAASASLPGNYVAWLSSARVDARSRIPKTAGGWARPDGLPFAESLQALLEFAVLYPPRLDEHGKDLLDDDVPVVTATRQDGTFYTSGSYTDCDGWTSRDGASIYRSGVPSGGTLIWTEGDGSDCSREARLFCFGIDDAASVQAPPRKGRAAFLSLSAFLPGYGLADADELCQGEAKGRALPGEFVALLASDGASAASRLSSGEPWVRPDGIAIVDAAADLIAGKQLLATVSLELDGQYHGTVGVWTGAPDLLTTPSAQGHCSSWSDAGGTGLYGMSGYTGAMFFHDNVLPCGTDYLHLYCLQK